MCRKEHLRKRYLFRMCAKVLKFVTPFFPHYFSGMCLSGAHETFPFVRHMSCNKHESRTKYACQNSRFVDEGQGYECLSAFHSYVLPTTAACQSCPHVGGSCMLCGADCSNTSCSSTEVLDLSPPSPLMTGCVWEDKERTQSVYACACVWIRVCLRAIPGYE